MKRRIHKLPLLTFFFTIFLASPSYAINLTDYVNWLNSQHVVFLRPGLLESMMIQRPAPVTTTAGTAGTMGSSSSGKSTMMGTASGGSTDGKTSMMGTSTGGSTGGKSTGEGTSGKGTVSTTGGTSGKSTAMGTSAGGSSGKTTTMGTGGESTGKGTGGKTTTSGETTGKGTGGTTMAGTDGSDTTGGSSTGSTTGPLPTDPREFCDYHLRRSGASFEERVSGCTQLADQILWQQPNGTRVRFSEWTRAQKDRINELYDRIQRNVPDLGVRCTTPVEGENLEFNKIYISAEEAFDMYAANIAQSIYLESNRLVPWSLLDNPVPENQSILDSSQYFSIITPHRGGLSVVRRRYAPGTAYQSTAWQEAIYTTLNCDPRIPYLFLSGTWSSTSTNLLGSDQNNTIKNISWWFHKNVNHGPEAFLENQIEWIANQLYLRNRLQQRVFATGERGVEAPMGCHSAANLFLELARGVNIPIRLFWMSSYGPVVGPFSTSSVHLGVAYHWTRPDARVAMHADHFYAENRSVFPINAAGSVMSTEEAKNFFFNHVWTTPAHIESWGYRYYHNLPLLLPGQDIEQTLPVRTDTVPDFGYYGLHSLMRIAATGSYLGANAPFELEKNAQACNWDDFLRVYCEDTSTDHSGFNAHLYGIVNITSPGLSRPLPVMRTIEFYMNRANECVRVNGSCTAIRARIAEDGRTNGNSFLRMP